jgi:hypothetical protein
MNNINEIGKKGEQTALKFFKNYMKINTIFQADWIIKDEKNNKYYLIEVKHQERFIKRSDYEVEGHGLPIKQIEARINFQNNTGIRIIFFVIEIPSETIYWQYLDILETKKYYDTKIKKRRIYDINDFVKIKIKSFDIK